MGNEAAPDVLATGQVADPDLFADLAAAGVQLAPDEAGGETETPVVVPAVVAPVVPAPAAAAPATPETPATAVTAEARKILGAAARRERRAAQLEASARTKIVEGLRKDPAAAFRELGLTPREVLAAMNPADTGEPAEPTAEERLAQLEAARVEDQKRADDAAAASRAEDERRNFEASKLATIEAVKNARVADGAGKQVEAFPRINHTGSHELVVELMLGYAERHSPKDAKGAIVPATMVTLSREDAAKQVEAYLAGMGVPTAKAPAPPARGSAPAKPTAAPAAAAPPPVVTAKDSGGSYDGPADEIEDFQERKAAVFKELGFTN